MRSPLNIDEFENYLEQEVNQHRMYPSDVVWRNIQQELHGYKKWPALTVISLFVISALVTGTLLIKPGSQSSVNTRFNTAKVTAGVVDKNAAPKENLQQHLSPEHITQQTIADVSGDVDVDAAMPSAFAPYHGVAEMPQPENTDNIGDNNAAAATQAATQERKNSLAQVSAPAYVLANSAVALAANTANKKYGNAWARQKSSSSWMIAAPYNSQIPDLFFYKKGVWSAVYGRIFYLSADDLPSAAAAGVNIAAPSLIKQTGLSSQKAVYRPGKFDVQVYVTPSASYRVLTGGSAKTANYLSGIPYNAGYMGGTGQALSSKPSSGYEVGFSVGYKLSSVFTLRTGLQFNQRDYNIVGYGPAGGATSSQPANGGNGANNSGLAGVNVSAQTASKLPQTTVFANGYSQIALPVGIDWKAWARGRFALNVATSIQPTYVFNKQPFLVTTDNNSFADGSKLMRNWNINANAETYFSYTIGKYKWQLGPQLRYQVLSTFGNSYPVKEHLIDYGIKLGVIRSLP